MSTFSALWRRSQAISVAAKEEQELLGHPEIDVEHLFLALVIVGGVSSRVLEDLGVTLRDARGACARVHAEQLAPLGMEFPSMESAAAIPDPSVGGFRWSDRGRGVMRKAELQDDDRGLLLALLEEPSGHVSRIVRQLGVSETAVREAARGCRVPVSPPGAGKTPVGKHAVSFTARVPSPPAAVWALVADPDRRLEWEGYFFESFIQRTDGVLVATARGRRPDGKTARIRPELRISEHVLSACEPQQFIEWEISWPAKPGDRFRRRFSIELQQDGAGTLVTLTQKRLSPPGFRARLLFPLLCFSIRQGHFARIDAISRALR